MSIFSDIVEEFMEVLWMTFRSLVILLMDVWRI
jgi:hypothetical protein